MKTEICAIFAIGPDNVIGIEDKMPWHSKQDFYHYKTVTNGYPCIFGDRTFFGLPSYPLPNRLNIVTKFNCLSPKVVKVSDNVNNELVDKGSYIEVPSIESGINLCKHYSKVFICGGRSIYKYCLENNLIDTIYLTKITSKSLSKNIEKNKGAYIRFPLDIDEYIKNWDKKEIKYDSLPVEDKDNDIKVKFIQYMKNNTR